MIRRNLGDLGESTLRLWAAQIGAIINPAIHDRRGWDFFVQFPHEGDTPWPSLDVRPPEIQCLIQVKSTSSSRSRKSISLANWEHLAKNPLPAFFLVFRYSKSTNSLETTHLIHVDKKWMDKVLRRLREESSLGTVSLSNKTIDLVWKDDDQLTDPGGSSLHDAIREAVGSRLEAYCRKKARLLEEMGDPSAVELTVSRAVANRGQLLEEWVDLAIGIRDSIEVTQLEIREDVRFGIPTTTTTHEGGVLTILDRSKEGSDIKLLICNNLINRSSEFDGKLHTPHHFFAGKPIPKEYFKARIVFPIGEVVIQPVNHTIRVIFDFSKSPAVAPLESFGNIWRLAQILNSVSADGCTISIFKLGEAPSKFPLAPSIIKAIDPHILGWSAVVDDAVFVASYLQVPTSTSLAFAQLIGQAELFAQVRAICDPNSPIEKIVGVLGYDDRESEGERAIAIVKRVTFGDTSALLSAGLSGPTHVTRDEQGHWAFEMAKPRMLFAVPKLNHTDDESATAFLDNAVTKLEKRGLEVIRMEDPWDRQLESL